jgi:hypothetical protein
MSPEPPNQELRVVVHYPPAAQPYRKHAPPTETVGELKTDVLNAFGLKEGPQPDGSNVTYTLYHGKTALENMAETLGALAGHSEELQLKLSQQITQGVA